MFPNVHYHQNKVVRIDDTDFILSTLWSHIPPQDEYFVSRGMNDFRQILYGGRRFTTDDFNVEHQKCLAFIKQSVTNSDAKHIVVVTYHLPTLEVVAPQHKESLLNMPLQPNWVILLQIAELMFGYLAIHMPTLMQLSGILELSAIRWAMCTTVSIYKISREISLLNYDTSP